MLIGDTVVFQSEVDAAMDAAFGHELEVTAPHHHLIGETHAYYFTHFWGKGSAQALARTFRAGLDAQKEANSGRAP